jgi:hypothetical protein
MGLQARLKHASAPEDIEKLPLHAESITSEDDESNKSHPKSKSSALKLTLSTPALFLILLYFITPSSIYHSFPFPSKPAPPTPKYIQEGIQQCKIIALPPPSFKPSDERRKFSDRFVEGTGPVLLKNGTVWTGEADGTEVVYGGNVWLEGGVIRKVGKSEDLEEMMKERKDVEVVDLHGAWVTPGVSDLTV